MGSAAAVRMIALRAVPPGWRFSMAQVLEQLDAHRAKLLIALLAVAWHEGKAKR